MINFYYKKLFYTQKICISKRNNNKKYNLIYIRNLNLIFKIINLRIKYFYVVFLLGFFHHNLSSLNVKSFNILLKNIEIFYLYIYIIIKVIKKESSQYKKLVNKKNRNLKNFEYIYIIIN